MSGNLVAYWRKEKIKFPVCCGVEYPERPNVGESVSTERPYACTLELADHVFCPFQRAHVDEQCGLVDDASGWFLTG